MRLNTIPASNVSEGVPIRRFISGTFMIAGTTIGAGMLGIPLETAKAGFFPSVIMTILVWFFMLCTGLLFLEVSLWMPEGTNVLSMANRFLGGTGRTLAGGVFVLLYYCLMVAYFAAGAPLLSGFFSGGLGVEMQGWLSYLIFGVIFWLIVGFGAKWIDRTSIILTAAMVVSYLALIGTGSSEIQPKFLYATDWSSMFYAIPILFSAFGYHNVIPSLNTHLNRDKKALRLSIITGTLVALFVYLIWQWIFIGSIPQEIIAEAQSLGLPATQALQSVTGKPLIYMLGKYFAFFAIVSSLLGVAFSMVDFLADGLKLSKRGNKQMFLSFLTFSPPFIFAGINPLVFDKALGIAGGFGEAVLNGLFPVGLVWMGRYALKLKTESSILGKKWVLALLFAISIAVMVIEAIVLIKQ